MGCISKVAKPSKLGMIALQYIVLISNLTANAQSQIITIKSTSQLKNISTSTEYLRDFTGKLGIDEVLKTAVQQTFKPIKRDIFNRSTKAKAYWLKFVIKNDTPDNIWLKLGDAFTTWELDYYTQKANGSYQLSAQLGALRPQKNKHIKSNFYCVQIPRQAKIKATTVYVRITGEVSKPHYLHVGTSIAISNEVKIYDYYFSAFVGLMICMILYNLFLFLSTKERLYILYLLCLLSLLITIPFDSGYPLIYHSGFWNYFMVTHMPVFLFSGLFAIYYLELVTKAPKLFVGVVILMGVLCVFYPLLNIIHYDISNTIFNGFVLLFYLMLLASGLYLWAKGVKNARFYVLAWFFLISSIILFVLATENILFNNFTNNSLYLGASMETLMFALALGDRLNSLKKEKMLAQLENLRLVNKQNTLLEEKVEEKTKELQEINEELQTSNEELTQMQEEISSQRDVLSAQNQKLLQYSTRINQSFYAAKLIQNAILPTHQELARHFQEYFVLYMPKDVVSGDFYWLYKSPQTKKLILVVADCTGHGVPGAFMTLIGNNLLDNIIKIKQTESPAQVLTLLHEETQKVLHQKENENVNGMDAIVITLDQQEQEEDIQVCFSGAKNSLLFYNGVQRSLQELKGSRKGIGGDQPDHIQFEEHSLTLKKGSVLYLGSDGVVDQNNLKRRKFGSQTLKQVLTENAILPLSQQKNCIEQALQNHMKGTEQRDDILWMGVKL